MINITDDREYLAVWFLEGDDKDWMAIVDRAKGETAWTLHYRIRYYATPDGVFDDRDLKNWQTLHCDAPDDQVIADVDKAGHKLVATGFTKRQRGRLWRRRVPDLAGKTLYEILLKAPFVHVSTPDGVDAEPTTNTRGKA